MSASSVVLPLQDILEVEQVMDENQGLELTSENIDTVLDEIRCGKAAFATVQCQFAGNPANALFTILLSPAASHFSPCSHVTLQAVPGGHGCCLPAKVATYCALLLPTGAPLHLNCTCRPYLVGTGGGGLELVELDGPIAKVCGCVHVLVACGCIWQSLIGSPSVELVEVNGPIAKVCACFG